jgi:hypothetical protein
VRGPRGGYRVGQRYYGGTWYGIGRHYWRGQMVALWRRRVLATNPDWLRLDLRVNDKVETGDLDQNQRRSCNSHRIIIAWTDAHQRAG